MQLTDWLLVEVAPLLIGLTKILFVKNWFSPSKEEVNCLLDYQRSMELFPLASTVFDIE
jgi:hypothetical protein